jgi:molybdenum cofactor biosynthesis enzyme MoaA
MDKAFNPNYDIDERKARIAISPVCNLKCGYCDQGRNRSIAKPGAMEDFRSTEMKNGLIGTDDYIRAMESLYNAGYSGVTFTGGEPFLNVEWPKIVKGAKQIGFNQVQLTTNAILLSKYIESHGQLPQELDLLTVSLDTFDKTEFSRITTGNLGLLLDGIDLVKKVSPNLPIKANKVVMRSNLPELENYVKLCEKTGLIDRLTLLNLVCKDPFSDDERSFFNEQFVPAQEIMEILSNFNFKLDNKSEYTTITPSGLSINLMDTDKTLRSDSCDGCPIYCQEGYFTARVATDGTIRNCSDFANKLPYVDSTKFDDSELDVETFRLLEPQRRTKVQSTLAKFCVKYGLKPKRIC